MCLDLKRFSFIKTAKKDITVYKFLDIPRDSEYPDSYFVTPFRYSKVEIGETYESELVKRGSFFKESEVDKGLHSFENINDARNNANYCGSRTVVECIIPKGTKYYKGTFGSEEYISYASTKLKYVKVIDNE